MNDTVHLKRLSGVKSNTGVKFLTPAASPGNHCPMHTALASVGRIRGLSSLLIGTPECTTYGRMIIPKATGKNGELHWLYVLESREVVFGCRDGLTAALRKMDAAGAKTILLIATCVPELIGEDVEGILYEIQPEMSARLTYVLTGHFNCNSYSSGYWKTLEALGKLMEKRQVSQRTVNILGRLPKEAHTPMPRLISSLEQRGFPLRYLAPGASLEDFMNAPDARMNLVVSPIGQPLAERMEQKFGIPYISLHNLYEISAIDKAYGDIAGMLHISWEGEFETDRQAALGLQEKAKIKLRGLRYVSTFIGPAMIIPLAAYLADFGMEPVLLHIEEFYPDDKRYAKELTAKGYNPLVCHMVNGASDAAVLEKLSPDLCIGVLPGGRGAFPCIPDMPQVNGRIGYERTSCLLKKILIASDNAKLSASDEVKTSGKGGI